MVDALAEIESRLLFMRMGVFASLISDSENDPQRFNAKTAAL
jgi:hypothetical protein